MAITLNIEREKSITIELNAKRTLDGNIMIFDHEDVDIMLMLEKKKCLTFPKEQASDKVYYTQDRMYRYLVKRGVIDPASVRGGNIYGSMEASILESKLPGVDPIGVALLSLYEYIKQEKPYFISSREKEDARLDRLLRPSDEYSTDLGDVPHADTKGAADPRIRPYGYRYNYSLLRETEEE
tara:strand:- start:681 stop:1226 length:546 start_codon:yes stop_codon:yes gene_type:complete